MAKSLVFNKHNKKKIANVKLILLSPLDNIDAPLHANTDNYNNLLFFHFFLQIIVTIRKKNDTQNRILSFKDLTTE